MIFGGFYCHSLPRSKKSLLKILQSLAFRLNWLAKTPLSLR
jgi:hypothetical protein